MKNKIWKIKDYEGSFSDEEIISLIRDGQLNGNDSLTTRDLKSYIKIKDSIYQYYLNNKEDQDETL